MRHWIQKEIVEKLIKSGALRYSELKPEGIEGNLFAYHLKQLMSDGLVEKSADRYQFTEAGHLFVDRYSLDLGKLRLQPKTLNALIAYDGDKIMVHRRKIDPFIGLITLVNGKLHFGEKLIESAHRELKEKTNTEAKTIIHRSSTYLSYFKDNRCFNHVLSHNFVASDLSIQPESTKHNEVLWMTRTQLEADPDTMNGTLEILDDLAKHKTFTFKEYRLNGETYSKT